MYDLTGFSIRHLRRIGGLYELTSCFARGRADLMCRALAPNGRWMFVCEDGRVIASLDAHGATEAYANAFRRCAFSDLDLSDITCTDEDLTFRWSCKVRLNGVEKEEVWDGAWRGVFAEGGFSTVLVVASEEMWSRTFALVYGLTPQGFYMDAEPPAGLPGLAETGL